MFTALCAPSLPEGSEGKNLNSAMQLEPLFPDASNEVSKTSERKNDVMVHFLFQKHGPVFIS